VTTLYPSRGTRPGSGPNLFFDDSCRYIMIKCGETFEEVMKKSSVFTAMVDLAQWHEIASICTKAIQHRNLMIHSNKNAR